MLFKHPKAQQDTYDHFNISFASIHGLFTIHYTNLFTNLPSQLYIGLKYTNILLFYHLNSLSRSCPISNFVDFFHSLISGPQASQAAGSEDSASDSSSSKSSSSSSDSSDSVSWHTPWYLQNPPNGRKVMFGIS